jgi:hypothetical protein
VTARRWSSAFSGERFSVFGCVATAVCLLPCPNIPLAGNAALEIPGKDLQVYGKLRISGAELRAQVPAHV